MGKRTRLALRQEVARAFREAMIVRNLTVTAAARDLGVSRQSMHKYLGGAVTPKADVVRRACSRWGLAMNVNGLTLSEAAFGVPPRPKVASPIQLTFSDMIQSLRDRDLDVKIIRVIGDSLELRLSIKFAS